MSSHNFEDQPLFHLQDMELMNNQEKNINVSFILTLVFSLIANSIFSKEKRIDLGMKMLTCYVISGKGL